MNSKDLLRKKYKALRNTLSLEEIEEKSIMIANLSLQLPVWHYSNFHLFLSIKKLNEVDTEPLLHILSGKDKNIILSKTHFDTLTMEPFLLTDNTIIKKNQWDIPEPENGIPFPTEKIEVVFIPLLAYDSLGNRAGYGKGFYDRFLEKCSPDCVKIGLSFFEPEEDKILTNSQDIKLNYCISPEKIYFF